MKRIFAVIASGALGFAVTPALAASQSGTGLTASVATASHLTTTYVWSLANSADPATQMVAVGTSANVHWTITATRSASGTLGGYVDGEVCVSNTGRVPTQGLAIGVAVSAPPSSSVLAAVSIDVSAKPVLATGASGCYPYRVTLPATALMPGVSYKASAQVSVTNRSGSLGMASGPAPSATSVLPTTPIPIDASITVTDTNGQRMSFSSSGSQGYDQGYDCTGTPGTHKLDDTATISSTGQAASAEATVECAVFPQSNALAQPLADALAGFGNSCVSFFLDTLESQSQGTCLPGTLDCTEGTDHHQGLARTPKMAADGSIYFFLSHAEVSDDDDRGNLMQFRYLGPVDNEHVAGQGVTAPLTQILTLADEKHPSDIDFLPDVNDQDSGYLFVAKEFGLGGEDGPYTSHKISIYYWQPHSDFLALGDIDTGLAKPSHILIDRISDDYYYLVVLDNTNGIAQPYKAYYSALFPSGVQGSMNIDAFQPLPQFSFDVKKSDLGSQVQLIRDSTGKWYVLVYTGTGDDGQGDDYVYVRDITFDGDVVALGDGPGGPPPPSGETGLYKHIILPAGETSFINTGGHYVDRDGQLLMFSSERWSHDRGDPYGFETRVDECR